MKEIQYNNFSLRLHKKNWQANKINTCQFELTFGCDFHCVYCYSDCYNNPAYAKKELSTRQVRAILDKVYKAGCLWLCLTGGDPLKRKDFQDIYSYAKEKGFIVTVFTNGYSVNKQIVDLFMKKPPFVVEITFNSTDKKTFEEITKVPGSYEKALNGIRMLRKRNVPVKIKTMIIKNNFSEINKIRDFVNKLGCSFNCSFLINARLNKDKFPCSFRVAPEDLVSNDQDKAFYKRIKDAHSKERNNSIFRCAAGSCDGALIDPSGKMMFCSFLRESSKDLLREDIDEVFNHFRDIRKDVFSRKNKCFNCDIREFCYNCPGNTFLEKGNKKSYIEWFCELAHLTTGKEYN